MERTVEACSKAHRWKKDLKLTSAQVTIIAEHFKSAIEALAQGTEISFLCKVVMNERGGAVNRGRQVIAGYYNLPNLVLLEGGWIYNIFFSARLKYPWRPMIRWSWDRQVQGAAGLYQGAGQFLVRGRGRQVAAGVVVYQDEAGGLVFQGQFRTLRG